jgi:hypothetical protein
MPSDKPRITLRIEPEDMELLEEWAKEEFLTVPQLARVILRRSIAARQMQQEKFPASGTNAKGTGDKGRGKKGGEDDR